MRRICFFTGTRAEYGIMSRLMRMVSDSNSCKLQIVATNMHLSPEFGLTYKEIEADSFHIDKKVEMLLSSDTPNGTAKSMGLATIGFADAIQDLKPDLAIILGDRFEMLCAAQVCLINHIPIAHLYGGENTQGAYDDAIRHAITKLSNLHFTSTEEYRQRVIQMGEQPDKVFWVGALGVDNIKETATLTLDELEQSLGFALGNQFLIITFHPATMEHNKAIGQIQCLLSALSEIIGQYNLLFTLPNSDEDGRAIAHKIKEFANRHSDHAVVVPSLGKRRYFSALKYATAVIGNSSSGLVEVPSFHIPTLNIGNRQKGRLRGNSVVDVPATYEGIRHGLSSVLSTNFKATATTAMNPYEKSNTAQAIFSIISNYPLKELNPKTFYNIIQQNV